MPPNSQPAKPTHGDTAASQTFNPPLIHPRYMTQDEKNELLEETRILKMLLNFHIQNRKRIALSDREFEKYVNAALDRLNEIAVLLGKKDEEK
ncbi:MAG: hypothetical protein IT262_10360 [Saprospiraceae bacterium]|nr:hypothetical protein [Saprospiraceae bacterium]